MKSPVANVLVGFGALLLLSSSANAIPVRSISGLESISFWERTGGSGPTAYTFAVNGAELTNLLTDPLSGSNMDIGGAPTEFYDVYYSDNNGMFELNGEYLTISGTFSAELPAGGGLNLAEIGLNFTSDPSEFGNFVASFAALGNNAAPGTVGRAIDGDLLTHTTMGNTVGQNERLRLTLGFQSSSGPPPTDTPAPGTLALFGLGLAGLGWSRRKKA